jgi:hypothetical protein
MAQQTASWACNRADSLQNSPAMSLDCRLM